MSKVWIDIKGMKSGYLTIPLLYELALLLSLLLSAKPRTIFYYNEMFALPLIVMVTVLFFQRELSGQMMEVVSSLPISLPLLLLRKVGLTLLFVGLLHIIWTSVYLMKFQQLSTMVYYYNGSQPSFERTTIWHLLIQALPEYVFMIMLTTFGVIVTKRIAGGLLSGFSVWMLFSLLGGHLESKLSLYTVFLRDKSFFVWNQTILLTLALVLLLMSLVIINRRLRWLVEDDEE